MASDFLQDIRKINMASNIGEILRRNFAMNAFDGTLASLGVIMGAFMAQVQDPKIFLITTLSAGFALFVSGFSSAYLAEEAERTRELRELEKDMLKSLKKTRLGRGTKILALEAAIVNGFSPLAMVFLIILPFVLAYFSMVSLEIAFYSSVIIALSILFLLGVFLGTISKQPFYLMGAKMLIAGMIAMLLSTLLGAL